MQRTLIVGHVARRWAGVVAVLLLCGIAQAAQAAIVNGDFSNGLNGWTTNPSPTTFINAGGNEAVFSEPDSLVVSLEQTFTIPVGTISLELILSNLLTEADVSGQLPDALTMSLLDASDMSLVPTVAGTTNFYIRDLVTGVTEGEAASGVSLVPSASALPLTIRLDVTALAATQAVTAKLLFELLAGGPELDGAGYTIDSVHLIANNSNPNVVPEPASIMTWAAGLVTCLAFTAICRRRAARYALAFR